MRGSLLLAPLMTYPNIVGHYRRRRRLGPTPRYMGLTGTASANDAAERAYHVFARRAEHLDEYGVAHTPFTFPMANT